MTWRSLAGLVKKLRAPDSWGLGYGPRCPPPPAPSAPNMPKGPIFLRYGGTEYVILLHQEPVSILCHLRKLNFDEYSNFAALGIFSNDHKLLGFDHMCHVPLVRSTAKSEANSLRSTQVWYLWNIRILLLDVFVDQRVCMLRFSHHVITCQWAPSRLTLRSLFQLLQQINSTV